MREKTSSQNEALIESLCSAWEAAADAKNYKRAYDIANQGIDETDDTSFHWYKYLSLMGINEAFGIWDGYAKFRMTFGSYYKTVSSEYCSLDDLNELLECANTLVDRVKNGTSYEALGRARALQILKMTVDQEQEKIALVEQAIRDFEEAQRLYQIELETTRSREEKEQLSNRIKYGIPELIGAMKGRLEKLRSGEETKALTKLAKRKAGGCFIATAVTGDQNSAEVIFLRQFRDQYLRQSLLGNIFIHFYHFFSPPIAQFISKSTVLRKLTMKIVIRPLVWAVRTFCPLK